MVVRIKKGAKIYTAFKIYPLDEERVLIVADDLDMSLSAYSNKVVLEELEHDEKS